MLKTFHRDSFVEYATWIVSGAEIFKRINDLLKNIELNGTLGEPERLERKNCWSRRITDEHRLLYNVIGENIYVIACSGHYED